MANFLPFYFTTYTADRHIKKNTDDLFVLPEDQQEFQRYKAFTSCELVHDMHRLALMNAMLHDIEGEIILGDTLSNAGKSMKGFDVFPELENSNKCVKKYMQDYQNDKKQLMQDLQIQ